jgi:hypothetical protein
MPTPKSISSNSTALAFAEETSLKVLPGGPTFYGLEPNSYPEFGAKYSTTKRAPIVSNRQKAKGSITDLDAMAGLNTDMTQRNLTRLLQGFFFADALEKPATNNFNSAAVVITGVTTAPNVYAAAAGLNVFKVGHLAFAKGFGKAGNNGLKYVSAIAAGALTTTTAGEVAEAAPPAGASLEAVGFQFAAGDLTCTVAAGIITLASAAIDLTTLALNIGEWIYVGGDAAITKYATGTTFFGRIASIAAGSITLDTAIGTPVTDVGAAKTIQIFFGKVLMNAPLVANIKRRSYTIERQMGNDGAGTQAEYLLGAIANELTLNVQQAGKVTVDLGFVAMDVQNNNGTTGLIAGATRVPPPSEEALNTSHDLVTNRIAVIDTTTINPAALFGFATDFKLTLKNNVAANKALAVLGAFEANVGDFDVEGSMTAYFASVDAVASVRNNSDVGLTSVFAKRNAGIVMDMPLLQLGDGLNKVEKDKPIMASLTVDVAKCPNGYTMLWNFFEYLPSVAMPA